MTTEPVMNASLIMAVGLLAGTLASPLSAHAVTTGFFDSSQTTNFVAVGTTSDTIRSAGYVFTYTRDKLFTGGVGLTNPIGRYVRVFWPDGLEAQAVTAGSNRSGAKLTLTRQDGQPFSIPAFTAKLLANTAGAGAAIEVMPKLNGEDALNDPAMYDASGYYGSTFHYTTPQLTNYEAYTFSLYVDFALMSLTAVDASPPPPELSFVRLSATAARLSWPTNHNGFTLKWIGRVEDTNWVTATNEVSLAGTNHQTTLPTTNGVRYFRLEK